MVLFRQSSSSRGSHVHRHHHHPCCCCHCCCYFATATALECIGELEVKYHVIHPDDWKTKRFPAISGGKWYHATFHKFRHQTGAGFHGHQTKVFQRKPKLTELAINWAIWDFKRHVPQLETLAIADSCWGNPVLTAGTFFPWKKRLGSICTQLNSPIKQTHEKAGWTLVACEGNRPPSFVQIAQRLLSGRLCISDSVPWPASAVLYTAHGMLQWCCGRVMWWEHPQRIVTSLVNDVSRNYCLHSLQDGKRILYLQRISNKFASWHVAQRHLFYSDFKDIRWHHSRLFIMVYQGFLVHCISKVDPSIEDVQTTWDYLLIRVNQWDVPDSLGCYTSTWCKIFSAEILDNSHPIRETKFHSDFWPKTSACGLIGYKVFPGNVNLHRRVSCAIHFPVFSQVSSWTGLFLFLKSALALEN